jgi:hypothetical protein
MIDLPSLFLPNARGRPSNRNPPSIPTDDDTMSMSSVAASVSDALSSQNDAASEISLPTSTLATQSLVQVNAMKLAGHPCAAGCGHYCWAANIYSDDL